MTSADSEQHESPGQLAAEDAVDDSGHEAALRGGGLFAADALDPLDFDLRGLRDCRGICRPARSEEPMALSRM